MTELTIIETSIASERAALADLLAEIERTTDPDALLGILTAVREYHALGKLRENFEALRVDVFRAEVAALLRAYGLDAVHCLPKSQQSLSRFIGSLHDAGKLEETAARFLGQVGSGKASAAAMRMMVSREQIAERGRERGRRYPNEQGTGQELLDLHAAERAEQAIDALIRGRIEAALGDDREMTVSEVYDAVVADAAVTDEAVAEGIREVIREHFRRGRLEVWEHYPDLPRWITVQRGAPGGEMVRIPMHMATVADLNNFIDLRTRQANEMQSVVDRLLQFRSDICADAAQGSRPLVELVEPYVDRKRREEQDCEVG